MTHKGKISFCTLVTVLMFLFTLPCWAADLLPFPADCDTPAERVEYSYRAQELLRYQHNVFSRWLHVGLSQLEYDTGVLAPNNNKHGFGGGVDELTIIPAELKAQFPYTPYITETQYYKFLNEWWKPRQAKAGSSAVIQRKACAEDPRCRQLSMERVDHPDGGKSWQPKKPQLKSSKNWTINVQTMTGVQAVAVPEGR